MTGDPHAARNWLDWTPIWKTELIERLCADREGAFLDVGANVGQTLLDHLHTQGARPYIGFEPNLNCVAFLQQIISRNRLNAALLPVAVSDSGGIASFFVKTGETVDPGGSLLGGLGHRDLTTLWAATVTLDSVWEAMGSGPIAAVKIDVEAAELYALQGMTAILAEQRPPILCEVLLGGADREEHADRMKVMWELLADHDYRVERVLKKASHAELEPVEWFPAEPWTPERAQDCDYLFSPL
jgi:FkbM family methyltransferase